MLDEKLIIGVLLCSILVICACRFLSDEGFRTADEKKVLAHAITRPGKKPTRSQFKNMGLDGVEYYDAKKLWNSPGQFTVGNVVKIL